MGGWKDRWMDGQALGVKRPRETRDHSGSNVVNLPYPDDPDMIYTSLGPLPGCSALSMCVCVCVCVCVVGMCVYEGVCVYVCHFLCL